jgi:hypothetical protein
LGSNEINESQDSNERNDRLLDSLEVMKEMKVKSIISTPFYERLSFYPWIITQALVAKLGIL